MTPTPRSCALSALLLMSSACFPTFQSARVEPGLHADVGVAVIADQERGTAEDGTDLLAYVSPAWGVSSQVELGLAAGVYSRDLAAGDTRLVLMPYVKVGLLPATGRDHLAVSFQTNALVFPANLGVHYGHDLGSWEPQISVTRIFSAGQAGDDPIVTRYQQDRQSLWALGLGATWRGRWRPGVQVGLLYNSYTACCEPMGGGQFGPLEVRYVDLFVAGRIGL
ncbi:MAG: hypothetical protein ABI542_11155 [Gemmatimonadota bacterium]